MRHLKWRTLIVCLILTSLPLGWVWWKGHRHGAPGTASKIQDPPTVVVAAMSPDKMDELLEQMWQATELSYRQQDPDGSLLALTGILDSLDTASIGGLLSRCRQLPAGERTKWWQRTLIQRAMIMDPGFALTQACELGAEVADTLLEPMLAEWKLQNPGQAIAWFEKTRKQLPGKWELLTKVFAPLPPDSNAAPPDLNTAWQICQGTLSPAGSPQGQAMSSADVWPLVLWARQSGDWGAALAKLGTLEDSSRIAYQKELLLQWSSQNWKDFQLWLASHPQQGLDQVIDTAAHNFLHPCWSEYNGIASSNEAQKYADFMESWEPLMTAGSPLLVKFDFEGKLVVEAPAGWHRDRITAGVEGLGQWATRDPEAASKWLKERPSVPWRDKAAAALSVAVVGHEPESALAWAGSIKDQSIREKALTDCWQGWRNFQPAAADAWMERNVSGWKALKQRVSDVKP